MNEHSGSKQGASKQSVGQHIPDAKRVEQERQRFQVALDEYLAALDRGTSLALKERKRMLLTAYAEFHYQTQGGTHCTCCRTPVRHVMTVEVRRANGSVSHFAALCTRCLEGEKAQAESVTLRLGPVEYETLRRDSGAAKDKRELPAVRRNVAA